MKLLLYACIIMTLLVSCATVEKFDIPDLKPDVFIPDIFITEETFSIMGEGNIPVNSLALFLLKNNPKLNLFYTVKIARMYVEESSVEGVNSDVAFAQMCLETGYLKFGGTVTPDQNNFCGLGTVSKDVPGERFETAREGIRAQIQHLKAYGSTLDLVNPCIDRRFTYVKRGIAPTIFELSGRWATNTEYGTIIKGILERMYEYNLKVYDICLPRHGIRLM